MLREQGYACISDPETGNRECSTFTCFHCQRITHVKAKADPANIGGLCKHCMKLICPNCVGKPCVPFLEQLDAMEARYHALRSYGLA